MQQKLSAILVICLIAGFNYSCEKKQGAADEQYLSEEERREGENDENQWNQVEINEFIVKASMIDKTQIRIGDMTMEKASNEDVRNFGNLLKNDHTENLRALKAITDSQDMNLPDTLDDYFNSKIQDLETRSGVQFDRKLLDMMVKDHKKDIAMFENAKELIPVENEMYEWVDNALPKLHRHEQKAQQLQNALSQDL